MNILNLLLVGSTATKALFYLTNAHSTEIVESFYPGNTKNLLWKERTNIIYLID